MIPRTLARLRRLKLEPWQRNLYTIAIAEMIAILGFSVSNPFLPFYIQELGITRLNEVAFWNGLINSAAPIAMALSSPIWGMIADRHGRKPMLVRAMLGGAVILGLIVLARDVRQVAALKILQGAITGTITAATALVATSVPRERCGFALGLLQTAVFVGSSLGPSIGGFIGGAFGYRAAFLGSSLLLIIAGVMVVLLVHERFERPAPQVHQANPLAEAAGAIIHKRLLLIMIGLLVMTSFAGSVTWPVLPLFVQSLVGSAQAASTATGLILGVTAAANAVAAIVVGRSADQWGWRRVLLICLGVGSLVYFPQMLVRGPMALLVLRAIAGFALGAVSPVANAVVAEQAPEGRQGGVFGISTSLNALGSALGPILGTWIVTSWSLGGVFPVTGALLGAVMLMVAVGTSGVERARRVSSARRGPS
ncbi:MAG: MFS transporter [Anaerolineae bacterium]